MADKGGKVAVVMGSQSDWPTMKRACAVLEELEVEDGVARAIGDYTEFANLTSGIEKLEIPVKKAGLERIPTQPVELTDEQMEEVEALLEKIEDDDDVQVVFTNIG